MSAPAPNTGTPPTTTTPPPGPPAGTAPGTTDQPPPAAGQTFTAADVEAIVQGRLARDRQSRPPAPSNLSELEQKAAQYDQLAAASRTDQERAVTEASSAAQRAGREALIPQVIAAEVRAASGGRITTEQAAAIVAPLAPSYFLDQSGAVDVAKVGQYVAGLLPGGEQPPAAVTPPPALVPPWTGQAPPATGQPGAGWPAMGQGARQTPPPAGRDAGVAEARRRFGEKTS